ncbi:hypothetical protein BC332_03731 [Capsicum chinense]|nr:hypothetical protein BC332_03731 [Capsicum chinense]
MDRDAEWSLELNIDSGGGTGGEDDDNDSQGGVGILHKNLTSSSSALQGLLRKLGAGLDDLLPSSTMRLASSSHRSGWLKKILASLRENGEEGKEGSVSCFVARLFTIEYMDLAEQSLQALKKISQAHPSACSRAGTLMVVFSYLDFFFAGVQRVALPTAAHMCKKLPSDASDLVLPMRMPENVNPRLRTSCCPRCKKKYDLELAKLVSEFENSSSEAKLESPRPQLPQWLQNDMLKNDSNVTSLLQGEEKVNRYVHLLNSTLTTIERIACWILENYHKEDGVEIPKVLRSYMSGKTFIPFQKMSIDLSLEDVKRVALHYGFIFEKESTIETTYTTNSRSMLQERPVDGSSILTVCSPLRGQNDPLLCQSIRGLHYVVDNMLIELLVYQLELSYVIKEIPSHPLRFEGNNRPRILNWKVVAVRPQFNQFMTGMFSKYSYANIVPTADEFETLDLARTSFASEHHDMKEKSKVDADSTSTLNKKELVVKADLHSLESEMKAYMKTYEKIAKQSPKEAAHSDDVVDFECHTNPDVGIEKQSDIAVAEIQPLESIISGREHDLALTIYKPPPTTPADSKGKKKLASNERKKFSFEDYHITGDSPTVEMEIFEEWIHDGLYKQHTKKKDDDDHYSVNCSTLEFRQLDFIVAFSKFKNWFYLMYQQNKCWNDEHLDVIMYYLRKKYKNTNFPISRYTTTDYFFKVYIDKAYVNYYNSDVAKNIATQDTSARTDEVADMEKSLINTIKGLSTCAGQPWHMVNEVFVSINFDDAFHWVLAVIALKDRCLRVYDSMASSQKRKQTSESEKLAVTILTYL